MTKKNTGFTAGIIAGLAAGLLFPTIKKKLKEISEQPQVKKTLKEILPSQTEIQKDVQQVKSLWDDREQIVSNATKSVKKQWNSFVGQFENDVENTSDDVSNQALKKVEKAAKVADASIEKGAREAKKAVNKTEKSVKTALQSAKVVTKAKAKEVAKKISVT